MPAFVYFGVIFVLSQKNDVKMLHELLLTLSGYPGGVFVEDARTGLVKVSGVTKYRTLHGPRRPVCLKTADHRISPRINIT